MEWFKITTSRAYTRIAVDEIVYVKADGNYCDLMLSSGKSYSFTFQLHFFEEQFMQLKNNPFERIGRGYIVNRRYVFYIDLTKKELIFSSHSLKVSYLELKLEHVSTEILKEFAEKFIAAKD